MKRTICLCLGIMLVSAAISAQSLGDAARKNRAEKKKPASSRVYTEDNVAANVTYNNGAASGPAAEKPATDADKAEAKSDDREKVTADWRAKFAEQKKGISLLERELDVMQREYRQYVAAYYADAGNQLRDQKAWAEQQRKFETDVRAKQEELSAARQKLEVTKEAARKAGLPSSISE